MSIGIRVYRLEDKKLVADYIPESNPALKCYRDCFYITYKQIYGIRRSAPVAYFTNKFYYKIYEGGSTMNNEQINATTGLTFRRAWFHMLNGKKVKRPSWKGYWAFENGTIMIYTMEGDIIDIRDTVNVAYTFSNIVENDWMVVEEEAVTP